MQCTERCSAVQVLARAQGELKMKNLRSFVPLACVLGVAACSSDGSPDDGGAERSSLAQDRDEDGSSYVTGGDGDGDGNHGEDVYGDGDLSYDGNLGMAAGSGGGSTVSVVAAPPSTEVEQDAAMGGAAPMDDFSTN